MISLFEKKEHASLACYFLLIICAAFALSYPLAFRAAANEQLFVGDESYDILLGVSKITSLATLLPESSWISGAAQLVPFSLATTLYALILAFLPAWVLPALLSLLILTLLWFTLSTVTIQLSARFLAACMFAFSPLFVNTQLSLSPAIFLFIIVAFFFLSLREHWHPLVCAAFAFIAGLFGIDSLLLLILILIFTQQKSGHAPILKQKQYATIGAIAGLTLWLILSLITSASLSSLFSPRVINALFIDFGAQSGQTILLVILALIGAVNIWQKELRWLFVAAFSIVVWSSFFPNTALITTAILSYFAGAAFTKIWHSKWTYVSLKIIVLSSILLAVLVSYFIFSGQLIDASPDESAIAAYEYIARNTPQDAIIFSSAAQSAQVAYFAQRQVVNTNDPLHALFEERRLQSQQILYAKTLSQALKELQGLNATHILIDPSLQSGDLWREEKGGLALLLRNKRAFTPMYAEDYLLFKINYDI